MKILCFGDSNTYGYDPRSYFGDRYPAQSRWVDLLAEKLGCEVVNAGENGREIPHRDGELRRFELWLKGQQPVDLLIVMLGGNDLLQGNTVTDAAERLERFLAHIDCDRSQILLIAPPTMQRGEWVPTQALVDASAALREAYRVLSERMGVRFADAGKWDIPLTFDGVHFTEEGHRAFAERIVQYERSEKLHERGWDRKEVLE